MVVPTVLDFNTHLLKMEDTRMQCLPLVKALRQSLVKRFSGIFTKTNMAKKTLTDTWISEVEKISSEGEATDSEGMNMDPPWDSPPVKFCRTFCPATRLTRSAAQQPRIQ
ncbi:uncharacterized protein LOC113645040, partial [Tachysurus ichikawai]